MKASHILFPLSLTIFAIPAHAQHSHGGGHTDHGSSQGQARPQESDPQKVHATNTICPVMGRPVKPGRDREVVIRGNYYLVCCDGCGPAMSEQYDKYLDKDGKPLNDPKNDPKKEADKPADKAADKPSPAAAAPEVHQH